MQERQREKETHEGGKENEDPGEGCTLQWRRSISGLHFVLGGSLGAPFSFSPFFLLSRSPHTTTRSYSMHTLIRGVHACTHECALSAPLRPSPSYPPSSLRGPPSFPSFSLHRVSLFAASVCRSTCGPRGCVGRDAARCACATREILIKIRSTPTHTPDEPAPS